MIFISTIILKKTVFFCHKSDKLRKKKMDEENWKDLDKSLFTDCCQQMEFDEFIYSKYFSSCFASFSPQIGNRFCDDFFAYHPELFISDALNSENIPIPNKNITTEEIIKISGYFLDQQIQRFNGESLFTTVLTSIYIQKSFKIENDMLNFIFKVFSYVTTEIEKYFASTNYYKYLDFFELNNNIEHFVNIYDKDLIIDEYNKYESMLPEEIRSLLDFELDLVELLNKPQDIFSLKDSYDLPKISECIGFSKYSHRKNACSHTQTLHLIHKFIKDINHIQKLYRFIDQDDGNEIMQIIEYIVKWNENDQQHLLLARYIFHSFLSVTINEDLFERDIDFYGFTNIFQQSECYRTTKISFISAFKEIFSMLTLPLPLYQKNFKKYGFEILNSFHESMYSYYNKATVNKISIKCQLSDHKEILDSRLSLWTISHSMQLMYFTLRNDFFSNLYGISDFPIVYHLLDFVCTNCASALDQLRVVKSFFSLYKPKTLIQAIEIEKKMPEESKLLKFFYIESHIFYALKYVFAFFKLKGALQGNENINEEKLYMKRVLPSVSQITIPNYYEYKISLSYGPDMLRTIIISTFNEAKRKVFSFIKENNQCQEINAIMRTIVSASICIAGFKDGSTVKVSFPLHPLYPYFEFVN